jgi:hypothetical protein
LPVAFFSAEAPDSPLARRAAALGPVFKKPDGLDEAVAWVTANR